MKTLIVSFGIIIMSIFGMTYQSDLNNYYYLQQHLQALTEECVAYAALSCYDEETGLIEFSESICEDRVNELLDYALSHMACFRDGYFVIKEPISFSKGENPKLSLKLCFTPNYDLFRLESRDEPEILHESCYEWIKYEENE